MAIERTRGSWAQRALLLALVTSSAGCAASRDNGLSCSPAPSISPSGSVPTLATAGERYLACFDSQHNCFLFACGGIELERGPAGADAGSGCVWWTPTAADAGSTVELRVRTPDDFCGDHASYRWWVQVLPHPAVVSFTADRTVIPPGATVTVTALFSAGEATWSYGALQSGVPATTPPLADSVDLVLHVRNAAGTEVSSTIPILVERDPQILSFTASPTELTAGDPVQLAWSASSALEFEVSPPGGRTTATSLTASPQVDTTYLLTAWNSLGASTTATARVRVLPPPRIDALVADPAEVPLSGATRLLATFEGGVGTLDHFLVDLSVDPWGASAPLGEVASGAAVTGPAQGGTDSYRLTVTNPLGRQAVADVVVRATGPGTFAIAARTPVDREGGPTLVSLPDGRILLVAGNFFSAYPSHQSAELFDPSTGLSGQELPLAAPRQWPGAALLADGRVLVAGGGYGIAPAEVLDLASGISTALGAPRDVRVWRPSVVPLAGGDALVLGLGPAEVFDGRATALVPASDGPVPASRVRGCRLADGRILVTGEAQAWLYDETSRAFTALPPPLVPRAEPVVLCPARGGALVLGGKGTTATGSYLGWVPDVERFDALAGAFSLAGTIPAEHTGAVELADGRFLLIGRPSDVYDPVTGALAPVGRTILQRYSQWPGTNGVRLGDGRVLVHGTGGKWPELFTP